jgi:hypothetical protein
LLDFGATHRARINSIRSGRRRLIGRGGVSGCGLDDYNVAHEGAVDEGFKAEILIDVVGTF